MRRRAWITLTMFAALPLVACHSAQSAPGMDANDLSDDRGARAGRFLSPGDNADADSADNRITVENSQ